MRELSGAARILAVGLAATPLLALGAAPGQQPDEPRLRLREYGIAPGILAPGPDNAITDVAGVRVGHSTVVEGDTIRTGVTAILPHGGNLFREKVPGAIFVANGFGKLAGLSQVNELGTLETPILLTGTFSVPRVADALISYMLELPGNQEVRSINPIVGETNDGGLSDIRSRPIEPRHVREAIERAQPGPVAEGSVGAGTGTIAFGFKGGIGTSSRRLPASLGGWTVAALVQTNFGGVLAIDGAPVGRILGRYPYRDALAGASVSARDAGDGSCMIVIATDAPVDAAGLKRLAFRGVMGMARTGASGSNGSGDYAIAFSTHPGLRSGPDAGEAKPSPLPTDRLSPLFLAAIEATEEAIYNSLFAATTTESMGRRVEALPIAETLEILERHSIRR